MTRCDLCHCTGLIQIEGQVARTINDIPHAFIPCPACPEGRDMDKAFRGDPEWSKIFAQPKTPVGEESERVPARGATGKPRHDTEPAGRAQSIDARQERPSVAAPTSNGVNAGRSTELGDLAAQLAKLAGGKQMPPSDPNTPRPAWA